MTFKNPLTPWATKAAVAFAASGALAGIIALHAHHNYQRGIKACTAEREADTRAAQDVGLALTEGARALFAWLTREADDAARDLVERESEAAARNTEAERNAEQWRLRYERLERDTESCSDALLDPDFGVLNDEARAGALGDRETDPD